MDKVLEKPEIQLSDKIVSRSPAGTVRGWSFADLHGSALAWIILFVSALITIAAWRISSDSVEHAAQTRFAFKAEDIVSDIERRMQEQEAALWGGVGLFNASDHVSREEWAAYAASLKLDTFLPGLQGFGYSEIVTPDALDAHVARIRGEGFPEFDVYPAGPRALYSSIIYLEPFRDRNLRAFGYDMMSEPTRRIAMERARDTGEASVSGMVTLVQETTADVQRGFLMYLPVYRAGAALDSAADRRAALQGFVYSPFRIRDLMNGILGRGYTEINFRIYDGGATETDRILYDSAGEGLLAEDEIAAKFTATETVMIGGRPWTITFRSKPGFIPPSDANEPWIIAAGGILIDILLFLTIASLTNQRRRAQAMAHEMTEELRAATNMAEHAAISEVTLRRATQATNEKLKTANERLVKFASIVAHDLRAPLKRIEAFIGILQDEYVRDLGEEGADIAERVHRGASRMRLMLDSLHQYTKVSRATIEGQTADFRTVADYVADTFKEDFQSATICINVPDPMWVHGDAGLLQHVLQNLVSNAVKFSGGRMPHVEISTERRDDGRYEIAVSDNGIGIDPKYADTVFDMFARLHNEDEYEGTGIGLAVCKSIVTDHYGDIWVDTAHEGGTRIVFTLLPATQPADAAE